ncbi:unannotated protein [freshwater metagenome]|uniref:Unannotated protein n=1 Tax=freshwater metagenome TaxID=449393 RepID=A0A6J7EVN3_9ZZZZ
MWLYPHVDILGWLKPARTVPITRWRSPTRWRPRFSTFVILIVGLYLFGTGESLLVRSTLGVSPWTVLAEGLATHLPISIGLATFLVSAVVLLLWIPLRERPGLGTISNAVVISLALQIGVVTVPTPSNVVVQFAFVLVGIALIGIGSGLYLTTRLGPGPRDGWMTGIHLRTGWPVARVRLGIEIVVLAIGWGLGGTVGIGTIMFALLVGPSVGYGLMLAGAIGRDPAADPSAPVAELDEDFPELDA